MIEVRQGSKALGEIEAVREVSLNIHPQNVFGMLGTNGAGKSTLLRMVAGVLMPDKGEIILDGMRGWDNPEAKQRCFYISDEQFFYPNAAAQDMDRFYGKYYPEFDYVRYGELLERFEIDGKRKIRTFSKGMKKQLSMLLGICANVPYLLCDETFDGLDPVMRQGIKSIFAQEIDERNLTLVIASHNLRELEDICDHIGILHRGGVLLEREVAELRCGIHRIQCVPSGDMGESFCEIFDVLKLVRRGKLVSMTVRGGEEEIARKMEELKPVYYEVLPLSLEEIFISETEVSGYDVKNLIQ